MNDIHTVQQLLDQLDEMQAQRQLVQMDRQAAIDKLLTPEIKAQIADIEAEFGQKTEAVNTNIMQVEAEIKARVIDLGTTVKGSHLQAVWNKGRISWDTRALDGYAIAHPEVAQFRMEGSPSISIRRVGQ